MFVLEAFHQLFPDGSVSEGTLQSAIRTAVWFEREGMWWDQKTLEKYLPAIPDGYLPTR